MNRSRPESGWRAASLAVALFAITLNFLQPLAHAALMRSGAPMAPWTGFCNSTAADPDGKTESAPTKGAEAHDCCLGLAQAPAFAEPPSAFILLEPLVVAIRFVERLDVPAAVGIRDGPSQPRGPPSLV